MLYLEDYIELVEILPQELRDRFTEMRLLDLQSQNSLDQINTKVNQFYEKAASMSAESRQKEYESLLQEYNKPLIDSEEKINLATQIQEFLNKYTRKLEQDIQKFKLELEADHSGITEILEKRVTDSQPKENAKSSLLAMRNKVNNGGGVRNSRPDDASKSNDRRMNDVSNMRHEHKYNLPQGFGVNSGNSAQINSSGQNSMNYSLSNIGPGRIAITAAASQAIVATQQMKQGRRTASLKASYEAIHGAGSSPADMNISKELAGAAQTAIAAIQDTHKKNKKKTPSNLSMGTINMNTSSALHTLMMETSSSSSSSSNKLHAASTSSSSTNSLHEDASTLSGGGSASGGAGGMAATGGDEEMDAGFTEDEPRYCQCNEVAFGVMVACDNKTCPYEWYHCECVGIAPDNPPKGKWYCPLCISKSSSASHHYGSGSGAGGSSGGAGGVGAASASGGSSSNSRKHRKT